MKFYGLKTCDTCRKAQKELRTTGISFESIDVRADGVRRDTLKNWINKMGWKPLLNTRSTTWRNLEAEEKTDIDSDKALSLLSQYPTLIKRPVIEHGGQIYVGWTPDTRNHLGL
ncbi:MAG TPA: Spx/MgsR family RNA polymerase-binding regulatory protein [Hellea balneolensis]|uniref:Spx/MgsR family RNA polymerase-binding regulatory protein n=1 Tax=Hellea balneolensis TaxID=287478 RepID=A0A7C5QX92_9PROT|nr:Spx/MgsR family RNA polymerase-binding regulatory protein [Hellea balneolensis]